MEKHICPVWIGYLLLSPLRKLSQNPEKILRPYIRENMTVLDAGCAMGFFSLPAARMVGAAGKVVCVDLQEGMIKGLRKRAAKSGLLPRVETRLCRESSLGLDDLQEKVDFAFAVAVVHEVPDAAAFFSEIYSALKPGGRLLMIEPKRHVPEEEFERSIQTAQEQGFVVMENSRAREGSVAVFKK